MPDLAACVLKNLVSSLEDRCPAPDSCPGSRSLLDYSFVFPWLPTPKRPLLSGDLWRIRLSSLQRLRTCPRNHRELRLAPSGNGTSQSLTQNSFGWHGTLAEDKGTWFGGVLDFSGDYANRTINVGTMSVPDNVRINGSVYPFLFGPRFYLRKGRLVFFGNPLIGGVHARLTVASVSLPGILPLTQTHWAYALGGGADYRMNDRFSIRGQADWIRSHFPETLAQDYQNSIRLSVGLVFNVIGH